MIRRLISLLFIFASTEVMAQKISFTSDINEMIPMSYPSRSGLSDFSFAMRNDSAFVHLPYMGDVYNPTFTNEGLNFDEPCSNITVKSTKKKDGKVINFSLRHDVVNYRFEITLWDNDRLEIFMQPSNAQNCRYMGDYTLMEEKEEKVSSTNNKKKK